MKFVGLSVCRRKVQHISHSLIYRIFEKLLCSGCSRTTCRGELRFCVSTKWHPVVETVKLWRGEERGNESPSSCLFSVSKRIPASPFIMFRTFLASWECSLHRQQIIVTVKLYSKEKSFQAG